jgi:hypothetical protein
VQGKRQHAKRGSGVEDGNAVRARGVHEDLARTKHAHAHQASDHTRQRVVGHREHHEVGTLHDLVGCEQGNAWQQFLGAAD